MDLFFDATIRGITLQQPFTSELKWLAAGDSELTFLLQEKKWPKEKKKPEHHFNQIQL